MSTLGRIGVAALSVGGGALGGYAIAQAIKKGEDNTQPSVVKTFEGVNIGEEKTYTNASILSQFAEHNRKYLVHTTEKANVPWWEWAYKNKYEPKKDKETELDDTFKNLVLKAIEVEDTSKALTEGSTESTVGIGGVPGAGTPAAAAAAAAATALAKEKAPKSLYEACDAAYKLSKDKFHEANGKLLKNIIEFCTHDAEGVDLTEPYSKTYKGLTPTNGYASGLLKEDKNKVLLVQNIQENQEWWKWAFKNIFKETEKDNYHDTFKNVVKSYEAPTTGAQQTITALNQACDAAYKKQKSDFENDNGKKLLDNISLLCTPTKNKATLKPLS